MDSYGTIYDNTVDGVGKTSKIVRYVGYLMSVLNKVMQVTSIINNHFRKLEERLILWYEHIVWSGRFKTFWEYIDDPRQDLIAS